MRFMDHNHLALYFGNYFMVCFGRDNCSIKTTHKVFFLEMIGDASFLWCHMISPISIGQVESMYRIS